MLMPSCAEAAKNFNGTSLLFLRQQKIVKVTSLSLLKQIKWKDTAEEGVLTDGLHI